MKTDKDKDLLDRDELVKSLRDLDFSSEEIDAVIEKGEKEGKFLPKEEKKEDDETIDEAAAETGKGKNEPDGDEVKKAYDKIVSMKDEIDKAMTSFLDMFGKVPGFTAPTEFVKKSEETDISKSFGDNFEKAFGEKFDTILKGFEGQREINDDLKKSIETIGETVNKIAETPNPLKSMFTNFNNSVIQKGYTEKEDGTQVYNLNNKAVVNEIFAKSIDKIENEEDIQVVRDMISSYTISGNTPARGLAIVKKALNVDFEK